jgi:hypothetical protein
MTNETFAELFGEHIEEADLEAQLFNGAIPHKDRAEAISSFNRNQIK